MQPHVVCRQTRRGVLSQRSLGFTGQPCFRVRLQRTRNRPCTAICSPLRSCLAASSASSLYTSILCLHSEAVLDAGFSNLFSVSRRLMYGHTTRALHSGLCPRNPLV